jgi:intermediate cleaving peptidase 55
VRNLYPHSIGHYLGMDVHDTPSFPISKSLSAGMVVTVEPGLYVTIAHFCWKRKASLSVKLESQLLPM